MLLFVAVNLVLQPGPLTWRSPARFLTTLVGLGRLAVDRRTRENHALEHATINVLEERYGRIPLVGLARRDGFFIRGPATAEIVAEASAEALRRLAGGDRRLALRRHCGTSLFVANLLTSAVVLIILLGIGKRGPTEVLVWLGLANLAGPFFGAAVQRGLTTALPFRGLTIVRVTGRPFMAGFIGRTGVAAPMDFEVETAGEPGPGKPGPGEARG